MDGLYSPSQEAALLRNLRDIAAGHLALWIDGDGVTSDRMPAIGTPDASGQWWTVLADRGWIVPFRASRQPHYRITDAGRAALAEGAERGAVRL